MPQARSIIRGCYAILQRSLHVNTLYKGAYYALALTPRYDHSKYHRLYSTPSTSSFTPERFPTPELPTSQQPIYDKLRPILEELPLEHIDWGVAYGSGVISQANTSPNTKPSLTDFLLSTPNPLAFHAANLKKNPSHYPLHARVIGSSGVSWLQENWGAGVWYVTMVNLRGVEAKYGIISTEALKRDLESWDTLYVAGRLHKPVLPLLTDPSLLASINQNHKSALTISLLLLSPLPTFTELELYEQIAGLSYSGDPRMSVPGAENPEKVRNIVKGEGVLEGMRGMYGGFLESLGVGWEGEKGGVGEKVEVENQTEEWVWKGEGEGVMTQTNGTDRLATLLSTLPSTLRRNIWDHYQSSSPSLTTSSERNSDPQETITSSKGQGQDDLAFWQAVARDTKWREVVINELRLIIRRPALTQSVKGLFTAGFTKSFNYSLAKFQKWLKGRKPKTKTS